MLKGRAKRQVRQVAQKLRKASKAQGVGGKPTNVKTIVKRKTSGSKNRNNKRKTKKG